MHQFDPVCCIISELFGIVVVDVERILLSILCLQQIIHQHNHQPANQPTSRPANQLINQPSSHSANHLTNHLPNYNPTTASTLASWHDPSHWADQHKVHDHHGHHHQDYDQPYDSLPDNLQLSNSFHNNRKAASSQEMMSSDALVQSSTSARDSSIDNLQPAAVDFVLGGGDDLEEDDTDIGDTAINDVLDESLEAVDDLEAAWTELAQHLGVEAEALRLTLLDTQVQWHGN